MRIALISPVARRCQGYHTIGSKIPQLGLQVLARCTPPPHTVDLIDEIFGFEVTDREIRRGRYDLVGITGYSSGATRAYEIAARCREEGIPTIMGGPHAWACPDEVARYVDSVAIGECDDIWTEIIADAERGELKPRYTGRLADIAQPGVGRASQNLQPLNGKYEVSSIQMSRGCPVGCDYCSVTKFNGPNIRRRDIDDLIEEWNQTPRRFVFVVDDNFFGVGPKHAEHTKEVLRQIIKRGKKRLWFSQTTINMGEDAEGLKLAYQAGCRGMLIGFESFNPESLKDFHKGINRKNISRYKELVDGFHRAGIPVFGAFIIGADQDTEETVADTAIQSVKLGIDTIQITNLTPLPGTKLYERWMEQNKIFATNYPEDWERYTFVETVYHPERMTAAKLDEAIYELRYAAANTSWVWLRTLRTLWKTRSLTSALFIHGMNKGWKRIAKLQIPKDEERFGFIPRCTERTRKLRDAFTMSLDKYPMANMPDATDAAPTT
ncbi:MAG: B12-binding domain-containing radical SAM protein [Phycisphaerales bacterium]|nr:B12-binding domain-containing radical SAM protein [Phycisphaerales bacterium]